jgi:hypothetical protein
MGIKIKNIAIKGIRGIKEPLILPLNERSVLLYGDNGTGKSSITDSIEWFFTNNITHLSSAEIDLKDALRNSFISNEEKSSIEIHFSRPDLNSTKVLSYKQEKLVTEFNAPSSPDNSSRYLRFSENENLLLRFQFLTNFINQPKGEKLKHLSDIIGFSEVTKVKEVLKKSFNSIKSEIKSQNFETQLSTQKQILIEKLGASVSQEINLLNKIAELIQPFKTDIELKSIQDIDLVLNHFKKPSNSKFLGELKFLENVNSVFSNLKNEIDFINTEYISYHREFEIIANDVDGVLQTFLEELLKIGSAVLIKKYHKDDSCPLCLQPKSNIKLQQEIQVRLQKIETSAKKKASYDKAKSSIVNIITERVRRLDSVATDPLLEEQDNKEIKSTLADLKAKLQSYLVAGNLKVTTGLKPSKPEDIKLSTLNFNVQDRITERVKAINEILKKDNSAVLYSNVSSSKDAFNRIKRIELLKGKLEKQKNALEHIYIEFVKKQKEGLELFINSFSHKIDEFYQYMNPGERFQEIRIVTIGEDEELNGITIEYKFNNHWISPPQKYFSESHLNCFGISFFLASVLAFNKVNKFIVLDDVISSFDTNHRQRFANLLFEKFSDYQIILLTHEQEWFSYVRQLAKRENWLINDIKWTDAKGAHLEEKPSELKTLIESSIAESSFEFLGNPIRKYLEYTLKDICLNLDVKVSFRFNETNEKRMPDELLNELKSKINKSSAELKTKIPLIDRVANSSLLGNLLSHDNPFNPKSGDLKAFWADIAEFEKLFYCQEPDCRRPKVSLKNYDNVEKKIRCGCDKTKYDWKQ